MNKWIYRYICIRRKWGKVGKGIYLFLLGLLLWFGLNSAYQSLTGSYTGLFGLSQAIVVSDSMEPNLSIGDFIVYKKTSATQLNIGDILIYKRDTGVDGEKLIIHRIIEKTSQSFVTKGDNNPYNDEEMSNDAIVGKYVFHIPKIGSFLSFVSSSTGKVVLVLCFVLFLAFGVVENVLFRKWELSSLSSKEHTKLAYESLLFS